MNQQKRQNKQVGVTASRLDALRKIREAKEGKNRLEQAVEEEINVGGNDIKMHPIDDQEDDFNFIVDDDGNAISYDDDDEDDIEEREKAPISGPLSQLVKNMALANQSTKSHPKGIDKKTIETKKGAINDLLKQLDDEDEGGDNNNKKHKLNKFDANYEDEEDIEMESAAEYINNNRNAPNMLNVSSSVINELPNNISFEMPKREKVEVKCNKLTVVEESPLKRTREQMNTGNPMLVNRTPVSSNSKLKDTTAAATTTTPPQAMLNKVATNTENTPIRSYEANTILEEQNMNSASSTMSSLSMRKPTSEQLPVQKDGSLYVYWYDAIEDNVRLKPCVIFFGKIYQPQTDTYFSISIVFHNINRTMYVLPKSSEPDSNEKDYEESMIDVYNEFEHLRKTKFNNIKSFQSKTVKRKYCFELPIDREKEHNVLKVKYNSENGSLPNNITGETFSYIFGKNSSLLETILISKKIQGPCWLKITNFEYGGNFTNTWTVFEVTMKDYKNIEVVKDPKFKTPPFRILSLSTKTIPSNNGNELFCISCAMKDKFHIEDENGMNQQEDFKKVILVRKIDNKLPGMENKEPFEVTYQHLKKLFGEGNLMMAQNEIALINLFINKVSQYDPDIIVGHNLYTGHIDTICSRINKFKPVNWSKIGRFKREVIPKFLQNVNLANIYIRNCLAGRLICDTFLSAKDVVRETNYDLNNICEKYLKYKIPEVNVAHVLNTFTSIKQIEQLLMVIYEEAKYSFMLMDYFSILPLTKQLTTIAGNLWIKSLQFSRADRGEMLLLHEFHNKKYIIPDKLSKAAEKLHDEDNEDNDNPKNKTVGKRKPAYLGGLVLEPQPGLYDDIVLLLDFNSLYPSIIQEFNICFTTVDRKPTQTFAVNNYLAGITDQKKKKGKEKEQSSKLEEENGEEAEFDEDKISIKQKEKAILPSIVEFLVKSRKKVKDELKKVKDPSKSSLLEIRQKALKLTANSLYGYLGYKNSRFYAKDIAQLITFKGRKILKNAADIVKIKHNLNVIYGDTDSVMINTLTKKVTEAVDIGNKIKKSINDQYHLLEMDIDGLFKSLLLLRKKKYASLKYLPPYREDSESVREIKGLDLVRRDWCALSKNIGLTVLDIILSGKGKDDIISDIIDKLQSITVDIDENKIPLRDFEITKQLAKNIDDYTDLKALPHVKVAKRLKDSGDTSISIGCYIPYIVCLPLENESNTKSIADRSYHPKEIEANSNLKIDIKWYKENQIYATVTRLVKHIQELDSNLLCKSLGIEAKHYMNHSSNQNQTEYNDISINLSVKSEVKHGVSIPCVECKEVTKVNVFTDRGEVFQRLSICDKCKSMENQRAPHKLTNNLLLAMKKDVFSYYRRMKKCFKCKENASRLFYRTKCPEDSCKGMMKRDTSEFETANELNFINKIVHIDEANIVKELQRSDINAINKDKQLQSYTNRMINNIAYNNIDMTQLFGFLNIKK